MKKKHFYMCFNNSGGKHAWKCIWWCGKSVMVKNVNIGLEAYSWGTTFPQLVGRFFYIRFIGVTRAYKIFPLRSSSCCYSRLLRCRRYNNDDDNYMLDNYRCYVHVIIYHFYFFNLFLLEIIFQINFCILLDQHMWKNDSVISWMRVIVVMTGNKDRIINVKTSRNECL